MTLIANPYSAARLLKFNRAPSQDVPAAMLRLVLDGFVASDLTRNGVREFVDDIIKFAGVNIGPKLLRRSGEVSRVRDASATGPASSGS